MLAFYQHFKTVFATQEWSCKVDYFLYNHCAGVMLYGIWPSGGKCNAVSENKTALPGKNDDKAG